VEDDRSARLAITRILQRQGFVVSEAATVAEAIRGLGARPKWILLDLMLPDGCGINVIRRAQNQGIGCKVCIITGCDSELLDEAHAAGADHTFIKPLDVERLMAVMNDG
jgi:two-component system CitB family response regulator